MALALETNGIDGRIVPDARDNILKLPPPGLMEKHVIGHDGLHLEADCEVRQLMEPELIVRTSSKAERQVGAIAEYLGQLPKLDGTGLVGKIRHEDSNHAIGICDHVVPMQNAVVLASTGLPKRDQAREPGVRDAVGGIDQYRHPVLQIEPTADDEPDPGRPRRLQCADYPGKRIPVNDTNGTNSQYLRSLE
ncbi:hypothetical protein GCM10008012_14340 [Rhizobium anhuiense]|nr:hypothetical protein GCM10008012_14340 [Rhizobium anhuiense]